MNVTNRRKSADAETPPTTRTTQHHSQHQQHQSLVAYISCRQAVTVSNRNNRSRQEEDQEQVVTSTSADSVLPLQAEGEGEEVAIELETPAASPARITSSTNNYEIVTYSANSLSLEEMAMPSTSENAKFETEETSTKLIVPVNNNNNRSTKSSLNDMVARDISLKTVADAGDGGGNRSSSDGRGSMRDLDDQSTSTRNSIIDSLSASENHKIILKLPKPAVIESQTISVSEDDLRKVEPLKINLHNTHHHYHHHSANTHHTPKIIIKPILKDHATDALVSSEDCSSSAEDEMVSKLNNSEPHIIPKLTIRAKNEDYGSSHTTVVPKLTIKINDSSVAESLSTPSAANTPPLPKLTIKTGQDGHSESIITNVSPAYSTTSSSSSLASSSATSSSSANYLLATPSISIPKLTIKPLQKIHDSKLGLTEQLPSIPKLCIKTNMLCSDVVEDTISSKIPKLTIKTGQEHAVIITQHNDHLKATGIPRLTIKTKSLDMSDESNFLDGAVVEKIPKLTIKTNTNSEISKLCRNKTQLEAVNSTSITPLLSPKHQAVPKLTISRHSNQMERLLDAGEGTIPKMTIKTQNKSDCVPKVTLMTLENRPSSTEESGISDEDEEQVIKTIPKLTIKKVVSPQQTLKIVTDIELNKTGNPLSPISNVRDELLTTTEDVDEFSDLLNVDNVAGESSNSQEFCGFSENIADCSSKKQIVVVTSITTNAEDIELRRESDDMDIDESLQIQHEPKIFQNIAHFNPQAYSSSSSSQEQEVNGKIALDVYTKMGHIIDTVDLTSSAGSSPAHRFDYNDEDEEENNITEQTGDDANEQVPTKNMLLECLQRETTVIQNSPQVKLQNEINLIPPPLHPKPNVNKSPASLKYPQLAERLMANGSESGSANINNQTEKLNCGENIIDSIEILDTPEGSPRNSLDERPANVKDITDNSSLLNGLLHSKEIQVNSFNNNILNLKRHASLTNKDVCENPMTTEDTNMEEFPSKLRKIQSYNSNINMAAVNHEFHQMKVLNNFIGDSQTTKSELNYLKHTCTTQPTLSSHQRSRKQKHENLLPLPIDEMINCMQTNSNDSLDFQADNSNDTNENSTPMVKRRGRPKKSDVIVTSQNSKEETVTTPVTIDNKHDYKSRRVQLLRKRLAIDMVDAEQPLTLLNEVRSDVCLEDKKTNEDNLETTRRERSLRNPLRASRRSNTPLAPQMESKTTKNMPISSLGLENKKTTKEDGSENVVNHCMESNSSISSVSSHSSSTLRPAMASASNSISLSVSTQIDLTMSSSSSSSNGSTTNTLTTVEASTSQGCVMISNPDSSGNGSNVGATSNNSMLPPTTILSSSDPLPDVIFRPNDFSSIIATQQLRGTHLTVDPKSGLSESLDEEMQDDASGADNSEDDSASSSSMSATPGRGRGRGRGGRSGRSSGRGHRSHRLGRGASDVAKSIAMNRPRCVGALKHTPDPERIKGLYSPSPQVFEEDTRMSADLTQTILQPEQSHTHMSQPDFFTNEESQSSVISNTSILDPNNIIAVQSGSAVKKPIKKKKMEVCVSEDADFTVASIAEYDWPPPKGCCPSKNRDTFMIQEQVAMYLGIKSFKRKYPDLPRRQVDMEERNWLQEKGLVSEKMCDLGITAVWASDILDIMYTDFYHKYEEYKDFVRQKHLREIEAKQKSLGLNVAGRGLQARERAMLSTSKWNSYFNRTRKDERLSCLDLQTMVVNKPCPSAVPLSTIINRPVAEAITLAAKAERILQPPTLLKPRVCEPLRPIDIYYPLSLVPGQFCEKYYDYSTRELRCFPLNTMLDRPVQLWQYKENGSNSSDTDSAVESIDNKTDAEKSSRTSASKRHCKRRIRRTRHIGNLSNDEFKMPPVPGTLMSATSSTDTCSSSDESSSESDSESTCCFSSTSVESSDDENSPSACGVCLRPHNRNLNDIPELFVQCYSCRRKVHPSCIEMPQRMAIRVRNYNWQCADCKCCIKCKRKQDQNKMLFCEQCDRGFHIYCLGIKAVPDGRWSCDRCSICMRCGSTKPEGLPAAQQQVIHSPNGERIKQVKHKKLKWINEYRLDHVTKLREHCSMLCVPCGRGKSTKRVQMATYNNTVATFSISPGSSSDLSSNGSNSYSLPLAPTQQCLPSSLISISSQTVNFTQPGSAAEEISNSASSTTEALCSSESNDFWTSTSRNSVNSITAAATTSNTSGSSPPVFA